MRQIRHIVVGVSAWVALVGLWVLLAVQHKVTGAAFRDTLFQLSVIIGVVLAVTTWWIRHNVGIYRRRGPRQGRADVSPVTDHDKLGRAVRWNMPGGVDTAQTHRHLIVEIDGDVKTYRRERIS